MLPPKLRLAQVGETGLPTEEWRFQQRTPPGRNHHAHSVGDRDQLGEAVAPLKHIRATPWIVRRDDLVFQAKLYRQLAGPRFFRHPGVRPALDDELLAANGLDDPAQPPGSLKECKAHSLTRQLIGGCQAADAAAHNRDAFGLRPDRGTTHSAGTDGADAEWVFAASRAKPCRASCSSAAVSRGASLSDCGRTTSRPIPAAKSRKPISMS